MFHLGVAKKLALLSYLARKWCLGWDSQGKFIPVGDLIDSTCFSAKPSLRKHKQTAAHQWKTDTNQSKDWLIFFGSLYYRLSCLVVIHVIKENTHEIHGNFFIHQTKQHSYDWPKLLGFSSGQDQCYKLSLKIQDLQAPTKVEGWWWIYPLLSHMLHAWNIHLQWTAWIL